MKGYQINNVYDIDSIKQKINSVEVVSFDVFDTLVHRATQHPVDVFDMIPRYIKKHHKFLYLEHKHFLRDYKRKRAQAEENARHEHFKKYRSYEINLHDIYEHLFFTNNVDIKFLDLVKQTEIDLELEVLYPNQYIREIYDYAISVNKKVIATTDMYLPTPVIGKILTKCGYQQPFEIFCSGELKHNKTEGDVFTYICQKYKIKPQDIFHIGDNKLADYDSPLKQSVNAFHIDYKNAALKQYHYKNEDKNSNLTESLIAGIVQKIKLTEGADQSDFYRLGYEVFGPIYTGYFIWLINELKRKPVDKILFFARDAYFIRNIYLKYKELLGIDIPEEYVYISRASSLLASFTDFTVERLWHLFTGRVKKTVEKGLSNIHIDHREVAHEIERTGFENSSDSMAFHDFRFMNLLVTIPDKVQNAAAKKRVNLLQYIESLIKNDNSIAIVDIGWTGNMQGGFGRIARLINPNINITGYYFGTNGGVKRNNSLPNNEYHGYLIDHGLPADLHDNVLAPGGIELLELAFVAPHSTTLDYINEGDQIKPVLEINHIDKEYQGKAIEIQQGGLKFLEEIMPVIVKLGIDNFVNTHWGNPFIKLVLTPSDTDAHVLGQITHTDSAIPTTHRLPLAKKLPEKLPETDPAYKQAYEEAIWKKGFEKLNKL